MMNEMEKQLGWVGRGLRVVGVVRRRGVADVGVHAVVGVGECCPDVPRCIAPAAAGRVVDASDGGFVGRGCCFRDCGGFASGDAC